MSDKVETCSKCKYFVANKIKEVPPIPATHYKSWFFGMVVERSEMDILLDDIKRDRVIEHNSSGYCIWTPKYFYKHKDDICGQFKEKK